MPWLPHQVRRLAEESALLRANMPDFRFFEPAGATYISGIWESQKINHYVVRIEIPTGYPDECPRTYLDYPNPLVDYYGRPLTDHGTSHDYHTWATDRPGIVQICTFRPTYWDSANTVIQLLHKSFLWIIAYEEHRQTGKPIKDLLLTM